ncbi:MAG: hypothetical protein AB1446_12605 [Bacillota bacterium]
MWYIAIGAVLFIWLVIAGAVNLATGYRYTKSSLAGLAGVFAGSAAAAQVISRALLPSSSRTVQVLAGAAITVPLFILLGTVMAEVWKHSRGKPTVDELEGWKRREDECLVRLAEVERELEALAARQREVEHANREKMDRQWQLRAAVEKWEQGGGVARIRATKVQQWQQELAGLSEAELERRRREVEGLMVGEADPVRREQLQIQGYLVELQLLARTLAQPNRQLDELRQRQGALNAERDALRQDLLRIRQGLTDWRRRRDLRSEEPTRLE